MFTISDFKVLSAKVDFKELFFQKEWTQEAQENFDHYQHALQADSIAHGCCIEVKEWNTHMCSF